MHKRCFLLPTTRCLPYILYSGGGADGSITIFADIETGYHPNIGLDEIIQLQQPILARHNVSVADL